MSDEGSVEEQLLGGIPRRRSANRQERTTFLEPYDASWPWPKHPRQSPIDLSGDLNGAVQFGLARDVDGLTNLTAMLCSGIPEDFECRAFWTPEGRNSYFLTAISGAAEYQQEFRKQDDELIVDQDSFFLPPTSRNQGNARRLARNLVYVYDELGVQQVSMTAGGENGAYTWAKLGASAKDPDGQRRALLVKLAANARLWEITPSDEIKVAHEIRSASDDDLMYAVASLTGHNGEPPFGKLLLVGHMWDGYWNLQDPKVRSILREALG